MTKEIALYLIQFTPLLTMWLTLICLIFLAYIIPTKSTFANIGRNWAVELGESALLRLERRMGGRTVCSCRIAEGSSLRFGIRGGFSSHEEWSTVWESENGTWEWGQGCWFSLLPAESEKARTKWLYCKGTLCSKGEQEFVTVNFREESVLREMDFLLAMLRGSADGAAAHKLNWHGVRAWEGPMVETCEREENGVRGWCSWRWPIRWKWKKRLVGEKVDTC